MAGLAISLGAAIGTALFCGVCPIALVLFGLVQLNGGTFGSADPGEFLFWSVLIGGIPGLAMAVVGGLLGLAVGGAFALRIVWRGDTPTN
ncbi:MAG: hypothetical protein U0556_04345 [Dehalococcoidia bacterium]